MYCSIEEAWPTYNYTNNPISRSNGVENFLNNEVNDHSIMSKNDTRPQFQTNVQTNIQKHSAPLPISQENIMIPRENSQSQYNHNQYDQHQYNHNQYNHNQYNHNQHSELAKIKNHFSHENHFLHNKHTTFCSCQDFMYHLQNCEECQNLMHNKFKPSKIEEILSLNPNIKETIVIFLVGILILMILNLFYK
jgi:hypothetical protein